MTIMEAVRPLEGAVNLERKHLAQLLGRTGRGINCRMDIPIMVLEDIRWASKVFSDLAAELQELGFGDQIHDEIYRILRARAAMEKARHALAITNKKGEAVKARISAKAKLLKATTGSA
jgi:hypothetical protein